MYKTDSAHVQSVDRAAEILRILQHEEALGLAELARRMALPKTTVYGLAQTLLKAGLLDKTPQGGRYRLGTELFSLGYAVQSRLRQAAFPRLSDLAKQSGHTVGLAVRTGDYAMYLERHGRGGPMDAFAPLGTRLPLYCTAVGRAFLSCDAPSVQRDYFARTALTRHTPQTITSLGALYDLLGTARDVGIAVDARGFAPNLSCIAAPVKDAGGMPVAAISISETKEALLGSRMGALTELLLSHAAALSGEL